MKIAATQLSLANAAELAAAGRASLAAGEVEFDFGAVERVDSAALAVVLEWRRAARAAGREIELRNLPASLTELADLYGVAELIAPPSAR